ncbi:IS1/IS1595 family N-terminal zinc-binding domain-containing protein [Thermoflexus hugenholtzii]
MRMVQETRTYQCARCGSSNIVKNRKIRYGGQKYHCKDCEAYRMLQPKVRYMEEQKELMLKVYQERAS